MQSLRQDLLLGVRSLRKEPASAVITSLTLALGIGLCTISFSLLYGVFFRGLDVPEANRLLIVSRTNPSRQSQSMDVTVHDFYDWSAQQTSFDALGHFSTGTVNLAGREGPERFDGAFVSANAFDALRVRPVLGTTFRAGDDRTGAPLTVVLGYDAWTHRFDSDPAIAGKSVIVNGEAATILGVMPEGFRFPQTQALWVADRDSRSANPDRARSPSFTVFGRLKDGVSREQAEQQMATIAKRLELQYPASNRGISARVQSFVENDTNPQLVAVFGSMQVATIFVLLIAIANVANLLMARATLRTREAAVRTALGASRLRVVLPFFAETLILATVGTTIGMGIAAYGVRTFNDATQGVGKPYYMVFALDFPVLVFVAGVTLLTALLATAAPAFYVLRTDINATLKDEVRGSSGVLGGRFTRVLVTAEIALSCALLVGAGLMVRSIVKLRNFEYPFTTENILTARVGLFETEYPTAEARGSFFRNLEGRLRDLPGARSVALTTNLPVNNSVSGIAIAGEVYAKETDYPEAQNATISPGFFRTFGTAVAEGRDFTENDNSASTPVAIVNRAFVEKFLHGREALGQRFAERLTRDSLAPWKTIVGIVPNLRMEGFDPDDRREWGYYVPLAQRDVRFASVVVEASSGDALALTAGVREAVRGLNPNLPIYNVDSMRGVIHQSGWFYFVFGTLFIVFGAAALFMATVGLYGVLSFSVSRRMKEMGIRMALGASARDVIRLVLRQGGKQIGVGLFLGLAAAYGLTRVIGLLMFEVTPQDPPVFTLVVVVIAAVGVLASLVPARRATRAEPAMALRSE
ncbi:MAG TPA: ABC transporter permease [Gemmatimonadales bacterium]